MSNGLIFMLMKRFFVFLAGVLIMTAAWGQQNATPDSKVFVPENDLMTHGAMTRSVAIQDGQVWWNNYDSSEGTWGKRVEAGHYDLAAYLTYDLVGGKGSTVDGLNFWGFDKMSNVKIWVSTTLPTSCDQADLEVKTLSGIQYYYNNEMLFDNKHIIPEGGLYVGFSFDLAETAAVITYTANRDNREGAFMFNGGSGWGQQEGCLTLRVLFGGDSFYQNAVSAMDFGSHRVLQNGSLNIPISIKNMGANTVSSIDYTITTSGVVSEEKHLELFISGFGSTQIEIPFNADATAAENQKVLTITKVNDIENTASDKTAMGMLSTMCFMPTAIPVIEEFTGTWCGYCPRGIAALNKIDDYYGDQVISIAVHGNQSSYRYDKMEISPYDFKSSFLEGYPSAVINRGETMDPSYCFGYLDEIIAASAPGEISVSAKWTNNSKMSIDISTKTKFAMASSSSRYSIGFVLVADGLVGTDYGWAQSNYYSGASGFEDDQYMYPFTQQPSSITDIEYNHVAVDGWGVQYGLEGSIPQSFSANKDLNYAYQADISENTLIQDKSKLQVIALLLDKNTGAILNAAKTTIAPPVLEINDIVQCIMAGTYDANADLNNDGKVDVADIVLFVNTHK